MHDASSLTQNIEKVVNQIKPNRVATYQSYPSEPSTSQFIANTKLPVLTPITNSDGTLSWQDLSTDTQSAISSGDLLLIPALAIDSQGNRLGRGKGYFDKELAKLPQGVLVYAIVFEDEFLTELPVEHHDRRVDGVISEVSIRKIN